MSLNPTIINDIHTDILNKLKIPIFKKAFTDPSHDNTKLNSNDRLEAIGDRILDAILYHRMYNNNQYD